MLMVLVIFEVGIFHSSIIPSNMQVGVEHGGNENGGWQPEAVKSSPSSRNNDAATSICPSALKLFDNLTEITIAIADNIHFHQRGGNLDSIEKYLNGHMQNTMNYLDVQFTPNGEKSPAGNAIQYLQDYYSKKTVKRGGYGQPLPGALSSKLGQKMIDNALFEKRWVNVIEPPKFERFLAGTGPVGPDCSHKITFAETTYEEKNLCIAQTDNDNQQKEEEEECNIISIGSNDQWKFEEEVMQKLPGCVTHTFDCTLKDNTPRNKPKTDNVKFYPYCIGSNDAQPPYLPYHKIWEAMQTSKKTPPKLLKMDVEGFEYDVLNTVLSSDPSIWPEQIMMEVHWASRMVDLPWMPRTRTAAEIALFFGGLFNHGGYILSTSTFLGCEPCMEILLIKAVC